MAAAPVSAANTSAKAWQDLWALYLTSWAVLWQALLFAMTTAPVITAEPGVKDLQELWASAYEGWIGPRGTTSSLEVVYLAPVDEQTREGKRAKCDEQWPSWVEATLRLADEWQGIFGLTAFNPLGQDRPHNVNVEQNMLLQKDVEQLTSEVGGMWWHSFGFAQDWHEKGFTVAAPEDRVVELAKRYEQGAVYRFVRNPAADTDGCAPFLRSTVPALLPDTEADVYMVPARRPSLDRADPLWSPPISDGLDL